MSLSNPTNMTESSANKLLNGDACHRISNGRKNGFVKNHCLFQEPRKYRRPRGKVRPIRQAVTVREEGRKGGRAVDARRLWLVLAHRRGVCVQ